MKKSQIKMLGLESVIMIGLIINALFIKKFELTNLANIIVWSFIVLCTKYLIGIEKDKSLNRIDTIQIIFIYTFLYLLIMYLIGVGVGFNRNPYKITILNIIKNITPLLIVITAQEIFRFNITIKGKDNKLVITGLILLFISMDIMFNFKYYSYTSGLEIFEVIGILILPSIADNLILTFITSKSGYSPTIIYRLMLASRNYLIPIIPDLDIYLESVLKIVFPTILFLKFNTIYAKNKFTLAPRNQLGKHIMTTTMTAVAIAFIALVSGIFRYYAISIGSESMEPNIKKGDAVVLEKIEKVDREKEVKKGVIIAYRHGKKVIVHRINKIEEKNGEKQITTKGDNNEVVDNWIVEESDILGIVRAKIPVIGWPSVWLSERL